MKKSLQLSFLLSGLLYYSQTEVVFSYDESGNQIYRGYEIKKNTSNSSSSTVVPSNGMSEAEKAFWKEITYGPNDVVDDLNIWFTQKSINEVSKIEIINISGNVVYTDNIYANLPLTLTINMRGVPVGNYWLGFYLKNGNKYAKPILKR